jgi:hypothetical protein
MPITGKSPSNDLQKHIISGTNESSGIGIARDLDNADLSAEDPMSYGGSAQTFEGDSDTERNRANLAQAMNLDSGDPGIGNRGEIDMSTMNANHGLPNSQADTMQYGTSPFDAWRKDNNQ